MSDALKDFSNTKIVIGNDHTASAMKREIIEYLVDEMGFRRENIINVGTDKTDRFNYPVAGYAAGKLVASGKADLGILICGTGIGISLAANKIHGIRACACSEPYTAKLSRQHNNTNMIAFGARVIGPEMAKMIVKEWLNAEFQGGRHAMRVDMIMEIEQTQKLDIPESDRALLNVDTQ